MRRRGPVLALAAVLLALPSDAHAAERSKCQKLNAEHDLAPAKKVKLVERKRSNGDTDLVGCVLPDGKLTTVASSGEESGRTARYKVRHIVGHHVLVDQMFESGGGRSTQTLVYDLKRRRWYSVASSCTEDVCNDNIPTDETATRALINSGGQAVTTVRSRGSDLVSVEGFSASGRRKILDTGTRTEIPARSLELDGHVASWTNDGAPKSATLPGPSACERLKARRGDDLAGARNVKLVERRNEDAGTDLVGCVLPWGRVSVVASSSTMPGTERRYQLLHVVGHEVLVRGALIDQYGHGLSTYVYDLKRVTSYNVAERCFDEGGPACDQTLARRAFVNAQGQAAAVVSTDGSSELQVLGFRSTGASRVLDTGTAAQIPPRSLSLEGRIAHWTHSGHPRHATLSG